MLAKISVLCVLLGVFVQSQMELFQQLGMDIDGEATGDQSGWDVSMSADGKTVAVGARYNRGTSGKYATGHTRVFSLVGDAWIQKGGDIDGDDYYDYSGHSVSLSDDGHTLAVGAFGAHSSSNYYAGHTRVFSFDGTVWVQKGADIVGENYYDHSGWDVSLSADGDRVAIGAIYNYGSNGARSGHVRVYSFGAGVWVQLGGDIDGGNQNYEYTGYSVSLSSDGETVAIGAHGYDGTSGNKWNTGRAQVYSLMGTAWVQKGGDINGEQYSEYTGYSVSLSSNGDKVAIGSYGHDANTTHYNTGRVRVFSFVSTDWVQMGDDINGEDRYDYSGIAVSISANGDTVAIGAYANDGNGTNSGHVRVYSYGGANWVQFGGDIDGENANDYSGRSVSLSANGRTVAIGAIYNDGVNGTNSGHVRVYSLSVDCPAGSQLDSTTSECLTCLNNEVNPTAGGTCDACAPPMVANGDQTRCVNCPAGSQYDATTSQCLTCPNGQMNPLAGGTCMPCKDVNQLPNADQTACLPCPAGTAADVDSATCVACPAGYSSSIGSKCVICDAMLFSTAGGLCEPCPARTKSDAGASKCISTECLPGTSGPDGVEPCSICPAGSSSNAIGSETCDLCSVGEFSAPGAPSCSPCPSGTYSSAVGSTHCWGCSLGSVTPVSGMIECVRCKKGYTTLTVASAHCVTTAYAKGYHAYWAAKKPQRYSKSTQQYAALTELEKAGLETPINFSFAMILVAGLALLVSAAVVFRNRHQGAGTEIENGPYVALNQ